MPTGRLDQAGQLAARNPNTQVVIDHLGLPQPQQPPLRRSLAVICRSCWRWRRTPISRVKISGAGDALAHEAFHADIWDPLCLARDAFGFERCLWGTDWTRAINLLTYRQGVEAFRVTDRLSDSDRAMLTGGALQEGL